MSSISIDTSEPDYQTSVFFNVEYGTNKIIFNNIIEGKNECANLIRKKLHQDVNKEGFIIELNDDLIYSKKILDVIAKMLKAQKVELKFQRIITGCKNDIPEHKDLLYISYSE